MSAVLSRCCGRSCSGEGACERHSRPESVPPRLPRVSRRDAARCARLRSLRYVAVGQADPTDWQCAQSADGEDESEELVSWRKYVPKAAPDSRESRAKRVTALPEPRLRVSEPEECLAWQLRAEGLTFDREYRFHESRLWRLDFWFADAKLAVEIDGGGFVKGRHGTGVGIEKDCEKASHIAMAGYRLMRVTPGQVKRGEALKWILVALGLRKADTLHTRGEHD